jgi:hypothetical protein
VLDILILRGRIDRSTLNNAVRKLAAASPTNGAKRRLLIMNINPPSALLEEARQLGVTIRHHVVGTGDGFDLVADLPPRIHMRAPRACRGSTKVARGRGRAAQWRSR